MKFHHHLSRRPFSFFIFLLFAVLVSGVQLHANGTNVGHTPEDPPSDNDKPPCPSSGSSNQCLSFGIPFPLLPHEPGLGSQLLRIHRNDPTPALFTPQSLVHTSIILTYVARVVPEDELPAGVSHQFDLTNQMNERISFQALSGSSIAHPIEASSSRNLRVRLLDEAKEPTIEDPVFYRLLSGDGSAIDYPTSQGMTPVWFRDSNGRVLDFSNLIGDDLHLALEDGFYRQIKSVSGLADIVTTDDFGYEIRFYTSDDAGEQGTEGLYEPTGDAYRVIRIENPTEDLNRYDKVRIIDTHGSYTNTSLFTYVPAAEDWQLTEGEGDTKRTEQIIVTTDPTTGNEIETTELLDAENQVISRVRKVIKTFPWNKAVIEEIKDPDGLALTKTYEYYSNSSEAGRYGKEKLIVEADGSWTRFDYDSDGRKIQEVTPWLDSDPSVPASQAFERVYSYTPVDSQDIVSDYDTRPRTVIEKTLGVETARTYYAYYTESWSGRSKEIEERTTVQGAAYGDSTNLRTVRTFYAPTAPAAAAGRLHTVLHPNGLVEAYNYAQEDSASNFVTTHRKLAFVPNPGENEPPVSAVEGSVPVENGSGNPLAGKSQKTKTTFDPMGNRILEERFVYSASAWAPVSSTTQEFSVELSSQGFRLESRAIDERKVLDQSWSGPLVTARTDEAGTQYTYFHDALDRIELEIKSGHGSRPDIVTHYDRSLGVLNCGSCDGQRLVKRTAGSLELNSHKKTDAAGRHSEILDENGYTTSYSYQNDGRITIVTRPDYSTRITERYLDGRIKSITGTGVIAEHYTYGVNADGTTWTRRDVATASSPRYAKTTFDVAGRMIREESPAYTGGTVLREMFYNDRGLLEKTTETGRADTLYEYDGLANLVRSGLDITATGSLDLASADRITDTETLHQQDGAGDWFAVTTTTVYPEIGVATGIEVSVSKRRLSGFGSDATLGTLAAEQISIDIHDNETVRQTWIDRDAKTVTRITDTPESDIDAVTTTVNGLLLSQNSTTVAASTTYDYDALERRVSIKDPRHQHATTFDYYTGTRQVFTQTDADDNTTAFIYYGPGETGAGQVKTVTDALLQKSYFAYDLLGRQIRTWGETDYPQEYGYTAYGELDTLTTFRDADDNIDFSTATWPNPTGGDTTTWIYHEATGLLTRKEYADEEGTGYTYDSANRLAVRTWARDSGLDTTYGYDPKTGELLTVDYEDPNTADITYTYDRLGRQKTVSDATGIRTFDYDPATLQLDTETLDTTFYDGMVLSRAYEDGAEINGLPGRSAGYSLGGTPVSATYGYATTGRLKTVSDGTDTFTYGYETDSNLLASIEGPVHAVSYDYEDNRNLMITVDNRATDLSGSSLSDYGYTYDALGRRDDRTQSGSAINNASTDDFAYNSRSEVTGSTNSVATAAKWNPTFDYDKIGNRKSSTGYFDASYSTNALNQYSAISAPSAVNPTHDLDGNLLDDGGNWTYTWNNENRLSSASNGTVTIDFTYDYQGRLVKKDDGTDVEIYVYDGWNRIATFLHNSSLTLQTSYLWGLDLSGSMQGAGGVGGLLSESEISNGQISDQRYALYDANGNIMQKLDGTGAVVMSVDYDPFGNIIDGTLVGEYGFSTKPLIADLQWYYYGFRYYDPETGRWPSRDPIEEEGGLNLYAILANSPLNAVDVLGLNPLRTARRINCMRHARNIRRECVSGAPDCNNPPCDADEWWGVDCETRRRAHVEDCMRRMQEMIQACEQGNRWSPRGR